MGESQVVGLIFMVLVGAVAYLWLEQRQLELRVAELEQALTNQRPPGRQEDHTTTKETASTRNDKPRDAAEQTRSVEIPSIDVYTVFEKEHIASLLPWLTAEMKAEQERRGLPAAQRWDMRLRELKEGDLVPIETLRNTVTLYVHKTVGERIEGYWDNDKFDRVRAMTGGNAVFVSVRQHYANSKAVNVYPSKAKSGITAGTQEQASARIFLEFRHHALAFHDDTHNRAAVASLLNLVLTKATAAAAP